MANLNLVHEALTVDAKMLYLSNYDDQGMTLDYLKEKPDAIVDLYIAYRLKQMQELLSQKSHGFKNKIAGNRKNQRADQRPIPA